MAERHTYRVLVTLCALSACAGAFLMAIIWNGAFCG